MVQRERDPTHPLAGPNGPIAIMAAVVVGIGVIVWGALRLGTAWAGKTADITTNPIALLFSLAGGTVRWPRQATYALVLSSSPSRHWPASRPSPYGGTAAADVAGSTPPRSTSAAAATSRPPRNQPSPPPPNGSA
jgi:hypothetical protein